ncbi:helix-turn-helix transcriptional regulator [Phytoactinopolyspora halotolerans]|uniref:Helix-turn-helix transcriptional regulator n=1 Tax=Phytoactinopolyspora halotolerans TaxID=1981512 RepID=A0A6L9SGS1_9ACTN|nr:AraC family transcriptional regulator [Phytoactinopolyspora halotolerans]NEE03561.1 helix-turn-helix transcriptional regulator [Phytoactinopolyspora halotolerans]
MRIDHPTASTREWPGMRSEYNWLPPSDGVTVTKPYQIGVSFSAHRQLVFEAGGNRPTYLTVPAGAVFANGHHELRWTDVQEPTEALEVYPDPQLLCAATGAPDLGALEIEQATAVTDATMLGIAGVLKRAHLHDGAGADAMHTSTLTHRLIDHMAEQYCRPRPLRPRRPGRLSRSLVDRLGTYVDDRLADQLTVDDLAREASLSVFHFARAFKRTTAMAPHEFVTMRRMERAKSLLIRTRESVPNVAYAVGYSNVSHFRRLLRRYTGFAPSGLRPR